MTLLEALQTHDAKVVEVYAEDDGTETIVRRSDALPTRTLMMELIKIGHLFRPGVGFKVVTVRFW